MHPFWHLKGGPDLREMILERPRQRAFLARYGRQDMFHERTIPEIERAVRTISEIVREENEMNRIQEDR